jgi:gluconolactonase
MKVFEREAEELIDPEVQPDPLADGFVFTEGPVWHFGARHLTFVDLAGNAMYRWTESEGVHTLRAPSNHANGLAYDHEGALVSCEHQTHRITREDTDGLTVLVDTFGGKRLNAPNDLVIAGDRSIVFTDPHYGLSEGFGGPAEQEQPVRGVYRLPPGGREPELLVDDLEGPNGLALTAAEDRLIVADSERAYLRAFEVGEGWRISGGDVLVELPPEGEGVPDGLKLDQDGNIFTTGPGGIWVCSSSGTILAHVPFPEIAANLAWGDDDARTLYVTASSTIHRLRSRTAGHVPHLGWTS